MPLCPQVIAVSKPKRVRWCYEELADLAAYLEGEVEETGFPGVCTVYTRRRVIDSIDDALRLYKFSFAKRVVIPWSCVKEQGELTEILENLFNILRNIYIEKYSEVRLIVSLRGRSKQYLPASTLHKLLVEHGMRGDRRSRLVLAIEGLDSIVAVAFGRERSCGYDCLLVRPENALLE